MNQVTKNAFFLTLITWIKAAPFICSVGSIDYKNIIEMGLEDFRVFVVDWTLESLVDEFKDFIASQGIGTPDQAMTASPMIYHEFRRALLRDEGIKAIRIRHSCGCIVLHPRIGMFGVSLSYVREENRVCRECFVLAHPHKASVLDDAERHGLHYHAERGNDKEVRSCEDYEKSSTERAKQAALRKERLVQQLAPQVSDSSQALVPDRLETIEHHHSDALPEANLLPEGAQHCAQPSL